MTPVFSSDCTSPGNLVQALEGCDRFSIVLVTPSTRKLLDEIWKSGDGLAARQLAQSETQRQAALY